MVKNRVILIFMTVVSLNTTIMAQKDFKEIIRYAIQAPSGHNTQPWKFEIGEDMIRILPDSTCMLSVVDGDNRELYISLGCALENLCIAAVHFGYDYRIEEKDSKSILVRLNQAKLEEHPLFDQIEKRQTNRSVYQDRKIPEDTLDLLKNTLLEPGITRYFAEKGTPLADALTQYIARGNTLQMDSKEFKEELLDWMRFNNKQIATTGTGLTYQVMGFPALPGFLSKPVVKMFLKPDKQNKSDLKKIASSSHLVLYTLKNNTTEEWIDLGRSLQRFLLKQTELGIASAYMNQPCEVEILANEMQTKLDINNEYPVLLLRLGYADPLPYSPRKDVEKVIISVD